MTIIIVGAFGASFFILALTTLFSVRHSRSPKLLFERSERLPLVSLLKPIKMIDDDLERNLESFFKLDYSRVEILFAVDHISDPCVAVIESIGRKYPKSTPRSSKREIMGAKTRRSISWPNWKPAR